MIYFSNWLRKIALFASHIRVVDFLRLTNVIKLIPVFPLLRAFREVCTVDVWRSCCTLTVRKSLRVETPAVGKLVNAVCFNPGVYFILKICFRFSCNHWRTFVLNKPSISLRTFFSWKEFKTASCYDPKQGGVTSDRSCCGLRLGHWLRCQWKLLFFAFLRRLRIVCVFAAGNKHTKYKYSEFHQISPQKENRIPPNNFAFRGYT